MADLKQPKPERIASLMLGKEPEGEDEAGPKEAGGEGDADCQAVLQEFFDAGQAGDMAAAEKALRTAVMLVQDGNGAGGKGGGKS